jgi:hypothetical protein
MIVVKMIFMVVLLRNKTTMTGTNNQTNMTRQSVIPGQLYDMPGEGKHDEWVEEIKTLGQEDVFKPSHVMGWVKVLFISGENVVYEACEMRWQHSRFGVTHMPISMFLKLSTKIADEDTEVVNECWKEGMYMYVETEETPIPVAEPVEAFVVDDTEQPMWVDNVVEQIYSLLNSSLSPPHPQTPNRWTSRESLYPS